MKLNVSHERIVFISVQSQTIWEKIFFFIFHLESVFFFNFRLDGKFNPLRELYYQDGTVLTSGWYEVKGHGVISRAGHKKDMKPSEICGFDSRGLKKEPDISHNWTKMFFQHNDVIISVGVTSSQLSSGRFRRLGI